MRRYPICDECGCEINLDKYDGCEKAYVCEGKTLCRDHFLQREHEYLESNTDDYAALVGVTVMYL